LQFKAPAQGPGLCKASVVHAAHAAAGIGGCACSFLGSSATGGDEEAGHGGCILQRAAHDFGGVDDALGDEVAP